MESSEHYLTAFLRDTLPTLGLDSDTYIPYIVGYIDTEDAVEENEEALEEVIQLLRASSETHSDLDQPWTDLKNDIMNRRNEYVENRKIEKVISQSIPLHSHDPFTLRYLTVVIMFRNEKF